MKLVRWRNWNGVEFEAQPERSETEVGSYIKDTWITESSMYIVRSKADFLTTTSCVSVETKLVVIWLHSMPTTGFRPSTANNYKPTSTGMFHSFYIHRSGTRLSLKKPPQHGNLEISLYYYSVFCYILLGLWLATTYKWSIIGNKSIDLQRTSDLFCGVRYAYRQFFFRFDLQSCPRLWYRTPCEIVAV